MKKCQFIKNSFPIGIVDDEDKVDGMSCQHDADEICEIDDEYSFNDFED